MPTVKLFANLRKLAGTKELSIEGDTVVGVLNNLTKKCPRLDGLVLGNGAVHPRVVVTLNGHNVIDFETPVTEQDNIAVFPPIAGGNGSGDFAKHPRGVSR
jgi:MoaD family protein